jgi:hypothetical protein
MAKRRRGRPSSGMRPGEQVKDYPRLAIRVPRRVVDKLEAMARKDKRPLWWVVATAIEERAERELK